MATENISTGNFYRILKDKATSTWDRISFWTHASDVELSSGTSLETDLNNKNSQIEGIQSDFAQIEPTSVSSHVYTKGMMLVYNNQLYRVTSAIAQGETLVVGTNIESASVGTLANMLTASNGNQFYLDVKDDTYGFYPSAAKVAEEFVPFGGSQKFIASYGYGWVASNSEGRLSSVYGDGSPGKIVTSYRDTATLSDSYATWQGTQMPSYGNIHFTAKVPMVVSYTFSNGATTVNKTLAAGGKVEAGTQSAVLTIVELL